MTPLQKCRVEFFEDLERYLQEEGVTIRTYKRHPTDTWQYFHISTGPGCKLEINLVTRPVPKISVGLTIQGDNAWKVLERFTAKSAVIETRFGESLDWEERNSPHIKEKHIQIHWVNGDFRERAKWQQFFIWIAKQISQFQLVFRSVD